MDHLQQYDKAQKAERLAQAALARQLKQQQSASAVSEWSIVTPSEHDQEELTECLMASEQPLKSAADVNSIANFLAKIAKTICTQ